MKYFTYELCNRINSESFEESEQASKEWSINDDLYTKEFDLLKDRLPKYFLKIYLENHGFHDFNLDSIEIINEKFKISSSIKIRLYEGDDLWEITYKNISKVSIYYSLEINYLSRYTNGFYTFAYDEFSEVNNKILSHEILFSTGASILIHFKRIMIRKLKNENKKTYNKNRMEE